MEENLSNKPTELNQDVAASIKKKGTKDFTPEERKQIIKRAERVGSVKAAQENNTSEAHKAMVADIAKMV